MGCSRKLQPRVEKDAHASLSLQWSCMFGTVTLKRLLLYLAIYLRFKHELPDMH